VAPATDATVAALDALRAEVEGCTRCELHATRTRGVPGDGDPASDLMFVGEAPGYHEDQQGRPFVGQAGKLLEELLASIGLTREQVFIANVLKSRPPNNRDPRPEEIAACRPYLWRQIELIEPKVICTLGNFATKLLSGDPAGITRVHGRPRPTEIAGRRLYLYPIFHPAAALYTPAMKTTLQQDFARLPELLAHAAPAVGEAPAVGDAPDVGVVPDVGTAPAAPAEGLMPSPATPAPERAATEPAPAPAAAAPAPEPREPEQLGLF
jgi:DNA polymerase